MPHGIVEHTTSWLIVNPVKGCSLGCTYCFRAKWHPDEQPLVEYSTDQAFSALVASPEFAPNQTPLSINASSTDAFLPMAAPSTFRFLDLLEEHGFRNPVGLITKIGPRRTLCQRLAAYRHVRPIIFMSVSLLPANIEPAPLPPRIRALASLRALDMPSVLYFRPIIVGLNDSPSHITEALQIAERFCTSVAVGGLRRSPEIDQQMAMGGLTLHGDPEFLEKRLPGDFLERIHLLRDKLGLSIPIYTHTSCALSNALRIPNYNSLAILKPDSCTPSCPDHQRHLCTS